MAKYDGASDRFWDGDRPLPRTDEEARKQGLYYDHATQAWWSGEVRVVGRRILDAYKKVCRDGFITGDDIKD